MPGTLTSCMRSLTARLVSRGVASRPETNTPYRLIRLVRSGMLHASALLHTP